MGHDKDEAMKGSRQENGAKEAKMSAQVLWMNIPLMIIAFGLWVGVPLWLVLRHPERHPRENRAVPAYLREQQRATPKQRQSPVRVRAYNGHRGLVSR
jgi:hypothetical protein